MRLEDVPTPALVLDLDRLERNCKLMRARAAKLGVALRPHLKTAKSAGVAKVATAGSDRVAVSTVAEAEYFAAAGFRDLTYAVGIAANKVAALEAITRRYYARITLIADSGAAVAAVDQIASEPFPVLIEIDSGAGRGGVDPDGPELTAVAAAIAGSSRLTLDGVLTHAGQSYEARSPQEIAAIAEQERKAAVRSAERLRARGHAVPVVSVGSTPTVIHAQRLDGVTEVRPGVYTLFDLDQMLLGNCQVDDIAATVMATVIGSNPRSQRLLIDAGALALSKDLSAAQMRADVGYGLLCPLDGGPPFPDVRVMDVHQEHGFVGSDRPFAELDSLLPVGTRVRILPNHVCMTTAPYEQYRLVRGRDTEVLGQWDKVRGW